MWVAQRFSDSNNGTGEAAKEKKGRNSISTINDLKSKQEVKKE